MVRAIPVEPPMMIPWGAINFETATATKRLAIIIASNFFNTVFLEAITLSPSIRLRVKIPHVIIAINYNVENTKSKDILYYKRIFKHIQQNIHFFL